MQQNSVLKLETIVTSRKKNDENCSCAYSCLVFCLPTLLSQWVPTKRDCKNVSLSLRPLERNFKNVPDCIVCVSGVTLIEFIFPNVLVSAPMVEENSTWQWRWEKTWEKFNVTKLGGVILTVASFYKSFWLKSFSWT